MGSQVGYKDVGLTYSEALVFPADEDGRNDVSSDEQQQKKIMQRGMAQCIEDAEADQADRPHGREEHA